MGEPTVTITRRLLAIHMIAHAVSVGLVEGEGVAEIVKVRKAEIEPDVAARTIFLRMEPGNGDSFKAIVDALEETEWQGLPFATSLWGIEFTHDVDAVHFALRFDDWIVR